MFDLSTDGGPVEQLVERCSTWLRERGLAEPGDELVFFAGVPPGVSRTTNVLKLHRVREALRLA